MQVLGKEVAITPAVGGLIIAAIAMSAGVAAGVAGVYILLGSGWALIAGAIPLLMLGGVMFRGALRAG